MLKFKKKFNTKDQPMLHQIQETLLNAIIKKREKTLLLLFQENEQEQTEKRRHATRIPKRGIGKDILNESIVCLNQKTFTGIVRIQEAFEENRTKEVHDQVRMLCDKKTKRLYPERASVQKITNDFGAFSRKLLKNREHANND